MCAAPRRAATANPREKRVNASRIRRQHDIRSERNAASATECVTNTAVHFCSLRRRNISSFKRSRDISSSAANGSSSSSSRGLVASARAIETRIFIPPESSRGYAPATWSRPTSSSREAIVFFLRSLATPSSSRLRPMLALTVRQGSSVASWKMYETVSRAFFGVMPSTRMVPSVGAVRPEINFSIVDLPHPEGPMMLTNSSRQTVRSSDCSTAGPLP